MGTRLGARLQTSLLRGLAAAWRVLPDAAPAAVGATLGSLLYRLDGKHRPLAIANIERALGCGTGEAQRIAKGAFRHFGRGVFEITALPSYAGGRTDRLLEVEGLDRLVAAHRGGRGVLLFSGHLGNADLLALHQARLGFPADVVVRPLKHPAIEALARRWRERTGNRVLAMKGALAGARRTLADGGLVMLQIDQNAHNPPRFFVPFLGQLASVTQSLGLLAVRYRPAVLPVLSIPRRGGRYRVVYGPPLDLPEEGSGAERAWEITARATAVIEGWVREHPDCWLWQHNRWKDQPREPSELAAVAQLRESGRLAGIPAAAD